MAGCRTAKKFRDALIKVKETLSLEEPNVAIPRVLFRIEELMKSEERAQLVQAMREMMVY